jgi:hypothetical protein
MSCIFVWLSTIQSLSYLPQQALEMRYTDVAALGTHEQPAMMISPYFRGHARLYM